MRTSKHWISRPERDVDDSVDMRSGCRVRSSTSGRRPLGSSSWLLKVPNVKLKVSSLLSQWVRRFAANPSGWTLLRTYWFLSCFGTSPSVDLAQPHSFNHSILPAFYSSLLLAWRSLDGSFDDRLSSLVFRVQRSSCPQSGG